MKILLFFIIVFFIGCTYQNLSESKARSIIQKEFNFPKIIDYDIFCSDPEFARKMLSTGLEEKEWVQIQKTQKLKDIGKPLITFTPKAKSYLLSSPEEYRKLDIQKVKIAEEDLDEIITIHHHADLGLTEVQYTTRLQNISPFSVLAKIPLDERKHFKSYFRYSDETWQLVNENDLPYSIKNNK